MTSFDERRAHTRYALPTSYTAVAVRLMNEDGFSREGHAYDLSEGGMRFELDMPVAPGTPVAIRIELPGAEHLAVHEQRAVFVMANVVWLEQDDLEEPGPVRMACVFRNFCKPGDQARLMRRLTSGRFSLAA